MAPPKIRQSPALTVGSSFLEDFQKNFTQGSLSLDKTCEVFEKHLKRIEGQYWDIDRGMHVNWLKSSGEFDRRKEDPQFKEHFETLQKSSHGIAEKLSSPAEKRELKSRLKKDKKLLMELREVCALSIVAKQNYNHTFMGRIACLFERMYKIMRWETSIEKAERLHGKCDALLRLQFSGFTLDQISHSLAIKLSSEKFTKQANLETTLGIMRTCAMSQKRIIHALPGEYSVNPAQILIAKPNGDVLAININSYQKGSGRFIFQATRYSIGKEPKKIAIMSTFPSIKPPNTLGEHIEAFQPLIQQVNENIQHEVKQVQKLDGIKGVINTQNPFSIDFNGTEFLFAEMDYFPLRNLNTFLVSENGRNLTNEQKEHLINSIVNVVTRAHDKGVIHRDIKLLNILVKHNEETNLFEAVLIDWETSRTTKEDTREFASTPEFWPPEYVNAYVTNNGDLEKGKRSLNDVPAVSLDYWNLGLVIYQIWHGKDYTTNVLNYTNQGLDNLTNAKSLQSCQKKNIRPLPLSTPMERLIRGLLDPDPTRRHIPQDQLKSFDLE